MALRRFVRLPELLRLRGVSKATHYRDMAEGRYPRPYRLGPPPTRAVGWPEDVVEAEQAALPLSPGGTRPTPRRRRR
jgi:predicted DNA-binding transcriptional regulator AlpA